MGRLTGEQLIDEVQALVGRPEGEDTELVTDARVTRFLNEAQEQIVKECPGIPEIRFKNVTSLDFSTDRLSYSISDITVGDYTSQTICYIHDVHRIGSSNSEKLKYVPVDEFDARWSDPTSSTYSGKPSVWTRRGGNIEVMNLCSSSYSGDDMRVDGVFYLEDFTTNDSDTCELDGADDGLIMYAVHKCWEAIGNEQKSVIWMTKFRNWLDDYRDYNHRMFAWDYNIYG